MKAEPHHGAPASAHQGGQRPGPRSMVVAGHAVGCAAPVLSEVRPRWWRTRMKGGLRRHAGGRRLPRQHERKHVPQPPQGRARPQARPVGREAARSDGTSNLPAERQHARHQQAPAEGGGIRGPGRSAKRKAGGRPPAEKAPAPRPGDAITGRRENAADGRGSPNRFGRPQCTSKCVGHGIGQRSVDPRRSRWADAARAPGRRRDSRGLELFGFMTVRFFSRDSARRITGGEARGAPPPGSFDGPLLCRGLYTMETCPAASERTSPAASSTLESDERSVVAEGNSSAISAEVRRTPRREQLEDGRVRVGSASAWNGGGRTEHFGCRQN